MGVTKRPKLTPEEWERRAYYASWTESVLQRGILDLCATMGLLVFHDPDARRCPHCKRMVVDNRARGFPDLFIVRPPKIGRRGPYIIVAELKTEVGTMRPDQKVWGAVLSAAAKMIPGFYYGVWRPHHWPAIQELLTNGGSDHEPSTVLPPEPA